MMMRWREHSEKGETDRQTDRRTDWTIHRAAWSQLKTKGRLFYTMSSHVHHFKAMGDFLLELQSGNAQCGSKSAILCPMWPWNLMDDREKPKGTFSILHQALCIIAKPSVNSNLSYSPETFNSHHNRRLFVLCDLEIWRMTLKNYRAPLLYYFKPCASFRSHWWIQTGVTVRKRPIWVKTTIYFSRVTLKFDR